jgi:hypothetical protein
MAVIWRGWQKRPEAEQTAILRGAETVLTRRDAGERP